MPLAALAAALRDLAPTGVSTGVVAVQSGHIDTLFPSEAPAVAGAVPPRRAEFAAGRALLRSIIGRPVAVPVGPNRAPILPADVVGSLAHDADVVVAAVGPRSRWSALGIDVETAGPMTDDEAAIILRDDERSLDPREAFVLKEAVYKAWSGLGGPMLDFQQVRVEVTGEEFYATVQHTWLGPRWTARGRHALVGGRWLALVVVR